MVRILYAKNLTLSQKHHHRRWLPSKGVFFAPHLRAVADGLEHGAVTVEARGLRPGQNPLLHLADELQTGTFLPLTGNLMISPLRFNDQPDVGLRSRTLLETFTIQQLDLRQNNNAVLLWFWRANTRRTVYEIQKIISETNLEIDK